VEDAASPDFPPPDLCRRLLAPDVMLLDLPEIRLAPSDADAFGQGRPFPRAHPPGLLRVYEDSRFLGVGESDGRTVRPRRVVGS